MAFHRLKVLFATALTGVLIAFSAAAQQDSARGVIDQYHASLINVMKEATSLGYEGRYQWLTPVIQDTFNLPFMAEIALGIYWAKASEEYRKSYVEAFSHMSTATYAERFDGYSGEKFEILGVDEEGHNSVVVRAQIVEGDGGHIPLNYLLRNFDGQWKVVDVYLNGNVSELAVKKSDYSAILKDGGMTALTSALNNKVDSMAKDAAKAKPAGNGTKPGGTSTSKGS